MVLYEYTTRGDIDFVFLKNWWTKKLQWYYEDAMGQDFDVEKLKGLSDDEVASRLSGEGYNELPQSKIRGSIYSAW